jgi:hypothetical protein
LTSRNINAAAGQGEIIVARIALSPIPAHMACCFDRELFAVTITNHAHDGVH